MKTLYVGCRVRVHVHPEVLLDDEHGPRLNGMEGVISAHSNFKRPIALIVEQGFIRFRVMTFESCEWRVVLDGGHGECDFLSDELEPLVPPLADDTEEDKEIDEPCLAV